MVSCLRIFNIILLLRVRFVRLTTNNQKTLVALGSLCIELPPLPLLLLLLCRLNKQEVFYTYTVSGKPCL